MKLLRPYLKLWKEIILLHHDTRNDFKLVFGLVLLHEIGFNQLANLWLQLKLLLVILMTIYHFYLSHLLNKFKLDQNEKTPKFYRFINKSHFITYFNNFYCCI